MTRYALVVVEGPHDRAFVSRILECLGFARFGGKESMLDPNWIQWKPAYPKDGFLYKPLDMPSLFSLGDWSVGVLVAGGGEIWSKKKGFKLRLANKTAFLGLLKQDGAVAFVLDADDADKTSPADQAANLQGIYGDIWASLPQLPGLVGAGPPRAGAFVVPDNKSSGTVESMLLPLGAQTYGPLLCRARWFVRLAPREHAPLLKNFNRQKATVAAAASILQPGATNTVTIEKDAWIVPASLGHPVLSPFVTFLRSLLQLP